jgi:hypothetical protein
MEVDVVKFGQQEKRAVKVASFTGYEHQNHRGKVNLLDALESKALRCLKTRF